MALLYQVHEVWCLSTCTHVYAHCQTRVFAATASDADSSDGEGGAEVMSDVGGRGMQLAVRREDGPAEQSEDEEGEGEEMEVLDPSHVSSHNKLM